jgi:hypothetical protein
MSVNNSRRTQIHRCGDLRFHINEFCLACNRSASLNFPTRDDNDNMDIATDKQLRVLSYECSLNFAFLEFNVRARGRVVGWGTMLQAGRSRVRFLIRSLDFSVDLTFPSALWPWGRLSL